MGSRGASRPLCSRVGKCILGSFPGAFPMGEARWLWQKVSDPLWCLFAWLGDGSGSVCPSKQPARATVSTALTSSPGSWGFIIWWGATGSWAAERNWGLISCTVCRSALPAGQALCPAAIRHLSGVSLAKENGFMCVVLDDEVINTHAYSAWVLGQPRFRRCWRQWV